VVFSIKFLLFTCQFEEESSSAGEQLASNKIDGYTVIKVEAFVSTFLFTGIRNG
jgi:hypothetical protein